MSDEVVDVINPDGPIAETDTIPTEKVDDTPLAEELDDLTEPESEVDVEDIEEEPVESEEEPEETPEEDLSNDTIYQQLKARDPKILKDIPELRGVIFREQEYTKLFPTVDDAKAAVEANEILAGFEKDLINGDSSKLLAALERTGKKSLETFVGNLTTAIEEQSKELYFGMMFPEFKKMLRAAARSTDSNIVASARNLNVFLFGNDRVDEDVPNGLKPRKIDENEKNLSDRERAFEARVESSFYDDISHTAETKLRKQIEFGFKDSGLSPLLQETLSDKVFKEVNDIVSKDTRHVSNLRAMGERAKRAGYTTPWKDSILSAVLSRAKVHIPKIRQKILAAAKVTTNAKASTTNRKLPIRIAPSSGTKSVSSKVDAKKIDWRKTSEEDFLKTGKAVLKG